MPGIALQQGSVLRPAECSVRVLEQAGQGGEMAEQGHPGDPGGTQGSTTSTTAAATAAPMVVSSSRWTSSELLKSPNSSYSCDTITVMPMTGRLCRSPRQARQLLLVTSEVRASRARLYHGGLQS